MKQRDSVWYVNVKIFQEQKVAFENAKREAEIQSAAYFGTIFNA